MKLVLLKEAARTGLFESEAAIRGSIARNELRKGTHWFQERRRGRIRIDLDACVEKFTRPAVIEPLRATDRIPVARGGFVRATPKGALRGL